MWWAIKINGVIENVIWRNEHAPTVLDFNVYFRASDDIAIIPVEIVEL